MNANNNTHFFTSFNLSSVHWLFLILPIELNPVKNYKPKVKSKNNSNKKKKDPQQKLIEKVLRSMDNNDPVEWERVPDVDYNPFAQPVAELPKVPSSFYFEELLSWMYNGYQHKKCAIYTDKDFITRHITFPPEFKYDKTESEFENQNQAPYEQKWDNMTLEDLSLKEEAGKDRIYHKSPALHVFLLSILEAVKASPDKFTATFAKQRAIENLLNHGNDPFQGERKCIELLIEELEGYLSFTDHQLIPTLYHFRDHGFIMSDDFNKLEKMDIKVEPEYTYEFGFSKLTSDNFIKQLITILHERKQVILKINNSSSKPSTNIDTRDNRINCKANKEEIRSYFLKLTHKDELGKQIMSENDVNHLLQANFKDFEPKTNIKKFNPNLNQANLRYFVYQFYQHYSKNTHEAEVYARLLKNNFSVFDNTELLVIKKKFSAKPAKYPSFLM